MHKLFIKSHLRNNLLQNSNPKRIRLGQLSQKVNFCRQIRGKVEKHTFLHENYALKTKILFTKLGSVILTFN